MAAPYSYDLREKAVQSIELGQKKSHVCRIFNISRNTLDNWLKLRAETGTVKPNTNYRRGPKPLIDDLEAFKKFAASHGHLTQTEMAQKWPKTISRIRIGQALKRIGFTRKKKTYGYRERDEQARLEFFQQISGYAKERFVYIDEAGVDNRVDYPYGYCHSSERFETLKLGHATERVSMISAWWCGSIVAPMVFEGYCNSIVVGEWMETFLKPELLPGQIVIIDNASFHSKTKIKKMMAQAGCEVVFLPPYSPDLNKIEKFWARLKNHLSKIINNFDSLVNALNQAFVDLSLAG
jgi:transposase